jgi:YD repeat-containing protein
MDRLVESRHGQVNVYSTRLDLDTLALTVNAPEWRNLTETYTYDGAGRKLTQTNGNNETTRYRYDAAGRVVEQRLTSQGITTSTSTTTYNAFGYKQSETDANGRTQTWETDAQGRILSHTDLGGEKVSYVYDHAKLLQTQTGTRVVNGVLQATQNLSFRYDGAGQLLEIQDSAVGRTSSYRYDAAGNRVHERTEQDVAGKGRLRLQDNYLGYDALGRLRSVFDGHLNIAIKYDLNGNRKEIATNISVLSSPTSVQEQSHSSTRSFEYDEMNRQVVVEEYDERRRIEQPQTLGITWTATARATSSGATRSR